jgi:hypothetical protein
MSDAQERLSREECAKWCDKVFNALNAYPKHWTKPHLAKPNAKQAAAYLRADADLAARLETAEAACAIMRERAERCEAAEAERDALAQEVASCRKALEWLQQRGVRVMRTPMLAGPTGLPRFSPVIADELDEGVLLKQLSVAYGIPLAHLTGEVACPDCDGRGWYVETAPSGDPEQVPCEKCKTTGKLTGEKEAANHE